MAVGVGLGSAAVAVGVRVGSGTVAWAMMGKVAATAGARVYHRLRCKRSGGHSEQRRRRQRLKRRRRCRGIGASQDQRRARRFLQGERHHLTRLRHCSRRQCGGRIASCNRDDHQYTNCQKKQQGSPCDPELDAVGQCSLCAAAIFSDKHDSTPVDHGLGAEVHSPMEWRSAAERGVLAAKPA